MKYIITFLIILVFGVLVIKEDNYSAENKSTKDSARVCPVTSEIIEQGAGVKYQYLKENITFCCEGCVKAFNKEPAKFLTTLTCPVCDEDDGNKSIYLVNNKVKYYFCSSGCKTKFDKDATKYLNNYKNQ